MPGGDTDKTEKATPKRREDARKKGQVAVSQDLNRAFQMMVALILFQLMWFKLFQEFTAALRSQLGNRLLTEMTDHSAVHFFQETILTVLGMLWPFFASLLVFMILVNVAQVGVKVTPETIRLNLGKLNPIKGLKKIFSLRSVMKLIWSLAKVACLTLAVYVTLKGRLTEIGGLGGCSLAEILKYCFSLLFLILFRVGMVLLVLALLDYLYQRWQYEQDLKMTKEEVKEEIKQTIGDPLIKRRIRQAQFKAFKQRMMEKVPEATVVVTNPTHYACAVKYERGEMDAPVLVAKGMNLIAERIKTIAKEHDIPLVENRILAQTLYRTVEVGSEIPPRLYRAVAEVLTFVYKLKGKV